MIAQNQLKFAEIKELKREVQKKSDKSKRTESSVVNAIDLQMKEQAEADALRVEQELKREAQRKEQEAKEAATKENKAA